MIPSIDRTIIIPITVGNILVKTIMITILNIETNKPVRVITSEF